MYIKIPVDLVTEIRTDGYGGTVVTVITTYDGDGVTDITVCPEADVVIKADAIYINGLGDD